MSSEGEAHASPHGGEEHAPLAGRGGGGHANLNVHNLYVRFNLHYDGDVGAGDDDEEAAKEQEEEEEEEEENSASNELL